jgi:hypothetical protein
MRLLIALLLSMVSLSAESMGVNATKLPPPRKGAAVPARTPPTMKMPATKQNAKKGKSKTPVQSGAIARAVGGKASKTGGKSALPPQKK